MRSIIAAELAVVKLELAKSKSSLLDCKPSLNKERTEPHGGYRTKEVAGAGASKRGPVHGRPGHRDRERRVALDQGRPRVLPGEPPVGDQRLRPLLRRLPAPGRAGGRSTRSAAALPRRHRPVHALLAAGGPGLVGGVADRGALVPGARRGGDLPGGAVDPLDDVHRGP